MELESNFAVSKRAIFLGDSRLVPVNSGQGSGESTLSSARNSLGFNFMGISSGVSGNTPAQMAARVLTDVNPYFDSTLTKNIVLVWGGVNAITAGQLAPAIYADLLSCCAQAKLQGFKVILCTEIPNTDYTGPEETERLALNVLILATTVPAQADLILNLSAICPAGQPTHPSPAAGIVLGNAMGVAILSL